MVPLVSVIKIHNDSEKCVDCANADESILHRLIDLVINKWEFKGSLMNQRNLEMV